MGTVADEVAVDVGDRRTCVVTTAVAPSNTVARLGVWSALLTTGFAIAFTIAAYFRRSVNRREGAGGSRRPSRVPVARDNAHE